MSMRPTPVAPELAVKSAMRRRFARWSERIPSRSEAVTETAEAETRISAKAGSDRPMRSMPTSD